VSHEQKARDRARTVLGSADIYAATLYYAEDSQRTQVARSALTAITMLIGDAVIVSAQFLVLTGVHDGEVTRSIGCGSYGIETFVS
jgi:hypothetical protein